MSLSLDAWRRARDISQREMSERLGVHINTYQKWETAPEKIGIGYALKIAEILDVDIDDISFNEVNHD